MNPNTLTLKEAKANLEQLSAQVRNLEALEAQARKDETLAIITNPTPENLQKLRDVIKPTYYELTQWQDEEKLPYLKRAIQTDNAELFQALVSGVIGNGKKCPCYNEYNYSCLFTGTRTGLLHYAAKEGKINVLKAMLAMTDYHHSQAFYGAVEGNQFACFELARTASKLPEQNRVAYMYYSLMSYIDSHPDSEPGIIKKLVEMGLVIFSHRISDSPDLLTIAKFAKQRTSQKDAKDPLSTYGLLKQQEQEVTQLLAALKPPVAKNGQLVLSAPLYELIEDRVPNIKLNLYRTCTALNKALYQAIMAHPQFTALAVKKIMQPGSNLNNLKNVLEQDHLSQDLTRPADEKTFDALWDKLKVSEAIRVAKEAKEDPVQALLDFDKFCRDEKKENDDQARQMLRSLQQQALYHIGDMSPHIKFDESANGATQIDEDKAKQALHDQLTAWSRNTVLVKQLAGHIEDYYQTCKQFHAMTNQDLKTLTHLLLYLSYANQDNFKILFSECAYLNVQTKLSNLSYLIRLCLKNISIQDLAIRDDFLRAIQRAYSADPEILTEVNNAILSNASVNTASAKDKNRKEWKNEHADINKMWQYVDADDAASLASALKTQEFDLLSRPQSYPDEGYKISINYGPDVELRDENKKNASMPKAGVTYIDIRTSAQGITYRLNGPNEQLLAEGAMDWKDLKIERDEDKTMEYVLARSQVLPILLTKIPEAKVESEPNTIYVRSVTKMMDGRQTQILEYRTNDKRYVRNYSVRNKFGKTVYDAAVPKELTAENVQQFAPAVRAIALDDSSIHPCPELLPFYAIGKSPKCLKVIIDYMESIEEENKSIAQEHHHFKIVAVTNSSQVLETPNVFYVTQEGGYLVYSLWREGMIWNSRKANKVRTTIPAPVPFTQEAVRQCKASLLYAATKNKHISVRKFKSGIDLLIREPKRTASNQEQKEKTSRDLTSTGIEFAFEDRHFDSLKVMWESKSKKLSNACEDYIYQKLTKEVEHKNMEAFLASPVLTMKLDYPDVSIKLKNKTLVISPKMELYGKIMTARPRLQEQRALWEAIENGASEFKMSDVIFDTNSVNDTAVHFAAKHGSVKFFESLLPNQKFASQVDKLLQSASSPIEMIIQRLIGANNQPDEKYVACFKLFHKHKKALWEQIVIKCIIKNGIAEMMGVLIAENLIDINYQCTEPHKPKFYCLIGHETYPLLTAFPPKLIAMHEPQACLDNGEIDKFIGLLNDAKSQNYGIKAVRNTITNLMRTSDGTAWWPRKNSLKELSARGVLTCDLTYPTLKIVMIVPNKETVNIAEITLNQGDPRAIHLLEAFNLAEKYAQTVREQNWTQELDTLAGYALYEKIMTQEYSDKKDDLVHGEKFLEFFAGESKTAIMAREKLYGYTQTIFDVPFVERAGANLDAILAVYVKIFAQDPALAKLIEFTFRQGKKRFDLIKAFPIMLPRIVQGEAKDEEITQCAELIPVTVVSDIAATKNALERVNLLKMVFRTHNQVGRMVSKITGPRKEWCVKHLADAIENHQTRCIKLLGSPTRHLDYLVNGKYESYGEDFLDFFASSELIPTGFDKPVVENKSAIEARKNLLRQLQEIKPEEFCRKYPRAKLETLRKTLNIIFCEDPETTTSISLRLSELSAGAEKMVRQKSQCYDYLTIFSKLLDQKATAADYCDNPELQERIYQHMNGGLSPEQRKQALNCASLPGHELRKLFEGTSYTYNIISELTKINDAEAAQKKKEVETAQETGRKLAFRKALLENKLESKDVTLNDLKTAAHVHSAVEGGHAYSLQALVDACNRLGRTAILTERDTFIGNKPAKKAFNMARLPCFIILAKEPTTRANCAEIIVDAINNCQTEYLTKLLEAGVLKAELIKDENYDDDDIAISLVDGKPILELTEYAYPEQYKFFRKALASKEQKAEGVKSSMSKLTYVPKDDHDPLDESLLVDEGAAMLGGFGTNVRFSVWGRNVPRSPAVPDSKQKTTYTPGRANGTGS